MRERISEDLSHEDIISGNFGAGISSELPINSAAEKMKEQHLVSATPVFADYDSEKIVGIRLFFSDSSFYVIPCEVSINNMFRKQRAFTAATAEVEFKSKIDLITFSDFEGEKLKNVFKKELSEKKFNCY